MSWRDRVENERLKIQTRELLSEYQVSEDIRVQGNLSGQLTFKSPEYVQPTLMRELGKLQYTLDNGVFVRDKITTGRWSPRNLPGFLGWSALLLLLSNLLAYVYRSHSLRE